MDVIIFSAGYWGSVAVDRGDEYGYRALYVLDNAPEKWGSLVRGFEVVKPDDERLTEYKDAPVYICTRDDGASDKVRNQLLELGFTNLLHFRDLSATFGGTLGYLIDDDSPFHPRMHITTAVGCHIMCRYCPQAKFIAEYKKLGKDKPMKLSLDDFKRIADKLPPNLRFTFAGWCEPFINKQTPEMIKYAYESGRQISLSTTLVGLTPEGLEMIKDVKYKLIVLHIPDDSDHSHIPVTDDYKKMLVKFLNSIQTDLFAYSVHAGMRDDIKEIVEASPHPMWNTMDEPFDRAGNLQDELVESTPFVDGPIKCMFFERDIQNNFNLLPDGSVAFCVMDMGLDFVVGNLLEQSFDEIYAGKVANEIQRAFDDDSMKLLCRTCCYVCKTTAGV